MIFLSLHTKNTKLKNSHYFFSLSNTKITITRCNLHLQTSFTKNLQNIIISLIIPLLNANHTPPPPLKQQTSFAQHFIMPSRNLLRCDSSTAGQRGTRGKVIIVKHPIGIEIKDDTHNEIFEVLVQWCITPARYIDESYLETLGMLNDVNWMFNQLGLNHFLSLKHPTYERVMLKKFSFVKYEYGRRTRGNFGSTSFRLFNRDFVFNQKEIGKMLQFHIMGLGMCSFAGSFYVWFWSILEAVNRAYLH